MILHRQQWQCNKIYNLLEFISTPNLCFLINDKNLSSHLVSKATHQIKIMKQVILPGTWARERSVSETMKSTLGEPGPDELEWVGDAPGDGPEKTNH